LGPSNIIIYRLSTTKTTLKRIHNTKRRKLPWKILPQQVSQCKNFTNFLCKIAGSFSPKFPNHPKSPRICVTCPSKKEMERSKKLRTTPMDSPRTHYCAKPDSDHETEKKSSAGHSTARRTHLQSEANSPAPEIISPDKPHPSLETPLLPLYPSLW